MWLRKGGDVNLHFYIDIITLMVLEEFEGSYILLTSEKCLGGIQRINA